MIKNATIEPQVFYGLHMAPGVAEYRDPDPSRILVEEDVIKNMDPSFQGKPVYVMHVEEVNLENIQNEADGYVSESFYNKADGKHWVKFLVVSDKGHEAIRKGWKLSNAYRITDYVGGGQWHGVDYQKKVTAGKYDHLAIVPNPRYSESVILTPEQFKRYNEEKESEILKLKNEGDAKMPFNIFKRAKIENDLSKQLEGLIVELPKSKKEVALDKLINDADMDMMDLGRPVMANGEHRVKIGDKEMSVNELVDEYTKMCSTPENPEIKKENEEGGDPEDKKALKEVEEKADLEKKKNALKKVEQAPSKVVQNDADRVIETSHDRVARGKSRYGSEK